jgi:hypothetical protein
MKIIIFSNSYWNFFNFRLPIINELKKNNKIILVAKKDLFYKKFFNIKNIIPKKLKLKRHNMIGLEGPESPFNYAYLCKECHKIFTFDKNDQYKIIDNFKKNKLISEEKIRKMIVSDNINMGHLNFLSKDNYINENEYNKLVKDLETRNFYKST